MQMQFERTAFEQVLRQLNTACNQKVIEAKANEKSDLRQWLGRNPLACVDMEELTGMDYREAETLPDKQPTATWMYELNSGALRYRWRHAEQLISLGPEQDIVRLRLTADYADANQNNRLDENEPINGLYLEMVHPFRWLNSSSNDQ